MPRNLDKRVEILFPVEDETLKAEVIHILTIQLQDTLKAHIMQPDGTYTKVRPAEGQPRTPTVSFTMEGYTPEEVSKIFGSKGINSWNGDFYAVEVISALGLAESGGLIRLGMAPYCTESDIDRVLSTVFELVQAR